MNIAYRQASPALDDCIAVYRDCTLGGRRPVDDRQRMAAMFANANLVVGAWDGEQLVGVARALTDTVYCTYLSDLAVRDSHQRRGIGTALISHLRAAAPQATLILLSAPQAVDYYPRIGFSRHESAWFLRPGQIVKGLRDVPAVPP
jgi:GNAT superfamily N-acetyltransferase